MKEIKTLGDFIKALETIEDKTKILQLNIPGVYPQGFASYRGYYKDIALGYETGYSNYKKVEDVLEEAKLAVGKIYTGWKGGDYTMTENTSLWIGNQGECPGLIIVCMVERDFYVDLIVEKTD